MLKFDGGAPSLDAVGAALESLRSRGPDDSGVWHDQRIALGHRRLSVIDPTPGGHQPMESHDRRFVIVFNGEIYNHREIRARLGIDVGWRSSSDTETLVEAYRTWGEGCLAHLNGMFAFAIWDRVDRILFAARDRMGVKPLYYYHHDGVFAFGSRPGAVCALLDGGTPEVSPEALRAYLELGYIPAPLSFHRDLYKLPPGHYLSVQEGRVRRVRYWDFRFIKPDPDLGARSEPDLVEELDSLIKDAVRLRLLADVPLGAFLSGGIDSALVVAAMKSAGVEHPKAFTIGFKEHAFNEGPAAAIAAELLGVDHVHETVDVNSLLDLLPAYVGEYDEPFADSSAFPTMAVARLARRHVTVALTGDGADELFGGYHYYPLMGRLSSLLGWRPLAKRAVGALLARLPGHRTKLLGGALRCPDPVALFHFLRGVGKDYSALVDQDVIRSTDASDTWFAQFSTSFPIDLSAPEVAMRLDAGLTLPELFLQKVDVATMAFSLEARCPMTDYRLVEWAMRLPFHYKVRNGETKYLLKQVLRRYLPDDCIDRPKMGFAVPLAKWLRGPLHDWAAELIHDDSLLARVPLDRERVRALFAEQASGARESHPRLWSVLMLLCYLRTHDNHRRRQPARYRAVA